MWMMPCSVVLGRGWSRWKVDPSFRLCSWWSWIRGGSDARGGGGFFSHFRCHVIAWGSFAGFIQSLSSCMTARCVLVRFRPWFSIPLRSWAMSEIAGWRNRAVFLPSHSSRSFFTSSSSSSRGKPASAVVAHTFWSGSCCWCARMLRSSLGVRMTSPSAGDLGSVVLSASPFWVLGSCVVSAGAGHMRLTVTPSSTSPSS